MISRWDAGRAQEWHAQIGWQNGFNYLPSTAVNSTDMFQASSFDAPTIERELGWAREYGFNSIRVFLPFIVWASERDGFLKTFEQFLKIAHQSGLSVAPILFDDCAFSNLQPYLGPQNAPAPGLHNSGWTPSPGFEIADHRENWPLLRQYVHAVVGDFKDDARVIFWDVYNEPGNSDRGDKSLPLLEKSFEWTREMAPSQPLTSGMWNWDLENLNTFQFAHSDIISFHVYADEAGTQKWLDSIRARESTQGRPFFCTEWMARTLESRFQTIFPIWKSENIGSYFWGFVNGKTQTHFPWGNVSPDEPQLWFHDLLRSDGMPYDASEADFVRKIGAS